MVKCVKLCAKDRKNRKIWLSPRSDFTIGNMLRNRKIWLSPKSDFTIGNMLRNRILAKSFTATFRDDLNTNLYGSRFP
jgi:hypothetical protein